VYGIRYRISMNLREIYEWLRGIKRPVFEDPKMQAVWEGYMDAQEEYQARLKSGEITIENFTEQWKKIVVPKRKAYEDYQALKVMGVTMKTVERKG